jgi:hypothetical protein
MAIVKRKETQTHIDPAENRSGKLVARPPRPAKGQVDYDGLIKEFMKQYPKARAYLAK